MTYKVFWASPYLTELETTVNGIEGNVITLHETIFYAFSGGQESDTGTINGYQVLKAEKCGRDIYYTLPGDHTLKINDGVKVVIDWDRRYKLMRLHFAAELVLEALSKNIPEIVKIGAHISQDKSRIDFEWEHPLSSYIPFIQEETQRLIDSNQKIISEFSDESQERRYWKIHGLEKVPCGGTHIKVTKEVGTINLKRSNIGKNRERINIYLID